MYSSGAVAGIAIGCTIASAAIVSAVFLLVQRAHRRPPNLNPIPLSTRVLDYLPQGMGHKELRQEFSQLETQIKTYVVNFFHDRPVHATTVDADKLLAMLGGADDHSSNQWSTQLCDTSNRWIALRMYIARVLWARVDPRGVPDTTLLPVEVIHCYQAALLENRDNNWPPLLDYWRAMTAYVLASQYPRERLAEGDPRTDNIKRTVADLLDALQPFRTFRTEGAEERSVHILEDIITDFAVLGFKIFSHINPTEVAWPPPSAAQVVLFPTLKQYRLDDGRRLMTIKEASYD